MSDDLRSTIEAAASAPETPSAPASSPAPAEQVSAAPASEVSSASPAGESQPASPVQGAAPDTQPAKDKPTIEEVAGAETKSVENDGETVEQREARHRVDRAPQSWKGEAKKLWEQLPLQVRQEVARRERDISMKVQEAAQDSKRVQEVMQVIAPSRAIIDQHYGGNPMNAINTMLGVDRVMRTGTVSQKVQIVTNMIKDFGVDIVALDAALSGQQMPESFQQQSTIEQLLEQKLAPFQQFLQTQQQQAQQQAQQVQQQVMHTVESMATDPQYPYFDDVRGDMADIIEINARRGVSVSLEDAYHRAVRMNDDVYRASSTRDSTQAATQQALDAHRAAQAAKGASVSVSGSPTGTGRNAGNPSDLRGTIASMFDGGRL